MTIQLIKPPEFPLPNFDDVDFISERLGCPAIATDGQHRFFVVWHIDPPSQVGQTSSASNIETSNIETSNIVAWRVQGPDDYVILAQHYQTNGTPVGDIFQVHTFRDLLQHCNKNIPSRIFYCSTFS